MNLARTHGLPIVAAILLGACSATPINPEASATAAAMSTTPRSPSAPSPGATLATPSSAVATVAVPAHLDPGSAISRQRSVFFDFDDFSIQQRYAGVVDAHARYLGQHPRLAVRIEGNSDERGSAEYNLALGQKRAESVMRSLELLGVKRAQLEAVSWGEEKSVAQGHDEAAWARNRRADLQYPGL